VGGDKHERSEEETAALITRIQEGSSGAFVRLSELYAPLLESEVARYTHSFSSADLEDLRQGALVSLYRAALAYNPEKGVTFGLFAKICIVNGIADTLRYVGKKSGTLNIEDIAEEEQFAESSSLNPQSLFLDKESMRELSRRIQSVLSELEYTIFELYIGGYSYFEIAARVGKSEKSVDNALCRIKIKLKKLFHNPV